MSELSFQDHWQHNNCWGCGCGNEHGHQIKSFWSGDEAICTWTAEKYHKAGPDNYLNGGVIATIIDCHSICTAIADRYREEDRELDSKPPIWCVTASMKIDYHKPTPIDRQVTLKAKVVKREGKKSLVSCTLYSDDIKCAEAEVLAVRVNPEKWF